MKNIEYEIITIDGKRYIEFPSLSVFGLKLMLSTSDVNNVYEDAKAKIDTLQLAYAHFGTSIHKVFSGYQVHSTNIELVQNIDAYPQTGRYFRFEFEATDGLVTDNPEVSLITKFADCTPVVLYAPNEQVLCSLHSGWRGTHQKISQKAINFLQENFGINPSDLVVFIGPAISKDDFEVADDLIAKFQDSHGDISRYLVPKENGKYLFDMKSLLVDDLLSIGILDDYIYTTDLSTFSNPLMHSYRRDKDQSGRMLLFAKMNGE